MSRLKQCQSIDSLIQGIGTITENRCSLSEKDLAILTNVLNLLKELKRKKGRTNEQILQCVVEVVILLSEFFKYSEDVKDETQK